MQDHFREKIIVHKEEQKVESIPQMPEQRKSPSKLSKEAPKRGIQRPTQVNKSPEKKKINVKNKALAEF